MFHFNKTNISSLWLTSGYKSTKERKQDSKYEKKIEHKTRKFHKAKK